MNKTDNTKIRPAQANDQKAISNILSDFKLPLDGLEETSLWVLQSNENAVVGFAGLEVYGTQGLLRSVAVTKDFQSQGYGTLLINHIIAQAKKNKIQDLFLLTTTAPSFFQKIGFTQEKREKVDGGVADSIKFKSACPKTASLMRLTLTRNGQPEKRKVTGITG
jgi:amino-acid N-acetyltransferase